MTYALIYLIKVSACLIVLYSIYYLTCRYFTFHITNRIFLIAIIAGSFIIPFVPIASHLSNELPVAVNIGNESVSEIEFISSGADNNAQTTRFSLGDIVLAAYALGALLFTYRFMSSITLLYRLGRQSVVEKRGNLRIKRTNGNSSYTFFNTIFLPRALTDEIILEHEKVHVEQYHWIDLVVVEIASIVLWFNPVIFLVKRELRLQHEFLADRSVLNGGVSFEQYAQCLIRNITPRLSDTAISPLGSTSIKNRIFMMTRKKTSRYALIIYLVMMPAAAILLMAFGRKAVTVESVAHLSIDAEIEQAPAISPVDLNKVTNVVKYGDRIHPATKKPTLHTGVDFALPLGSNVVSTGDGEVITQQYGDKEGNYVVIRHDDKFITRYYHLQKASVKVGDQVKKGQVIGLVGSSGVLSSGPHLHYEVVKDGTSVDPKDYLPAVTGL
jgi:beta-lactamase regulating signal transducer with metallopeptidase domain